MEAIDVDASSTLEVLKVLALGLPCFDDMLHLALEFPAARPTLCSICRTVRAALSAAARAAAAASPPPPSTLTVTVPAAAATVLVPTAGPFASVRDIPHGRAKVDVDVFESLLVVRPRGKGGAAAETPTPMLIEACNVVGAWCLTYRDRLRPGPAGVLHALVIALAEPIMVGKTAHRALCFSDTEAGLVKGTAGAGVGGVPLLAQLRAPDASRLAAKPPAYISGATALAPAPLNALAALRSVLPGAVGSLGEADLGLYASTAGGAGIKCFLKVTEGVLFPLRRAFIWVAAAGAGASVVVMPLGDVKEVKIGRGGGVSGRTFDLDIITLDGKTTQFSMLDVAELDALRAFVGTRTFGRVAEAKSSKAVAAVPVKTQAQSQAQEEELVEVKLGGPLDNAPTAAAPPRNINDDSSDDDEDDEEYDGQDSDDDDEDDSDDSDDDNGSDGDDNDHEEKGGLSTRTGKLFTTPLTTLPLPPPPHRCWWWTWTSCKCFNPQIRSHFYQETKCWRGAT